MPDKDLAFRGDLAGFFWNHFQLQLFLMGYTEDGFTQKYVDRNKELLDKLSKSGISNSAAELIYQEYMNDDSPYFSTKNDPNLQ